MRQPCQRRFVGGIRIFTRSGTPSWTAGETVRPKARSTELPGARMMPSLKANSQQDWIRPGSGAAGFAAFRYVTRGGSGLNDDRTLNQPPMTRPPGYPARCETAESRLGKPAFGTKEYRNR